jgi:hypothetical protein
VRPEWSLHAALAVDLLDAVVSAGDFSSRPSRSHPAVPPAWTASAAGFWLAHRVAGLVVRLYTPESLGAALGEQGADALRAAAHAYQRRALLFQQALRSLLQAAQQAEVWIMPIKGIMDAQDLYGDPGARSSGDMDVLVKPEQMEGACDTLRALGYAQIGVFPTLPPRAKRWWLATQHAFEWKNPTSGVFLDLHWRMNELPMVSLDDSGWFQVTEPGSCWGVSCRRLPPVERYVALLTHAERSLWFSLRWWADLVRARDLAACSAGELELTARLRVLGALTRDRQWLAALSDLRSSRGRVALPSGPAGWLLNHRRPTALQNLRHFLRPGYGSRYYVLWLRCAALRWGDVTLLRLPDPLFPLYFLLRPVLKGCRVLRDSWETLRAK